MIVLGYWKIRGLAQSVRFLLEYCGLKYEEQLYECGPGPEFSRDAWLSKKYTLGFPFPNLPYLIDDGVKLTQFDAILRYIAEKYLKAPNTPEERAKLAMLNGSVMDVRNAYVRVVYSPNTAELKLGFEKELPNQLRLFSEYLGDNVWLSGESVNYPDFNFAELLDVLTAFIPGCLEAFPKLKEYHKKFMDMPKIKAYVGSPRYMKSPYNNKMAGWGGDS